MSRRVAGQPAASGPGAVGGVRRPDGVAERRGQSLARGEYPAAAEAADLLRADNDEEGEVQGGLPGEGESTASSSRMVMVMIGAGE